MGAIVVQSVMTVGVVRLLEIPGLMLVGGPGLLWIAYKLLADQSSNEHDEPVVSSFWAAMKTIMVADSLMIVDKAPGVAGAAQGLFDLVIIGLWISISIVVFGSTMVLKLVERFPAIINIGAAVMAFADTKMILSEPLLNASYRNADAAASSATLQQRRAMGRL